MTPPRTLRPAHLADFVADQLRQQLRHAGLSQGDRLATEHELVARYGVSRTVVREAVAQLKSEGLVESRQGAGLFLARGAGRRTFRLAARDARLQDAFELRLAVEVGAAGLAAERRTREDLVRLERALSEMPHAATRADADRRFHAAVGAATGNALYASFLSFLSFLAVEIGTAIREAVEHTARHLPEAVEDVVEEHRRVFEAIEAASADAARAAMASHLANALRRLGSDERAPLHSVGPSAPSRRHGTR